MAEQKNVFLGKQTEKEWEQVDIEKMVFESMHPNMIEGSILLHQVNGMRNERKELYKTIKESNRHKIFIGPAKLDGINKLLCIDDFIEVPPSNAFANFPFIFNQTCDIIRGEEIILFASGLMSKVLIHQILEKYPNTTCLDIGSAFDSLFIGQTRTNQISQVELFEYYRDLL